MERTAREMTGRVENVGAKIKEMTREVLWLRGLVVDRDGVEALEQYYRDSGVAWHPERGLMHRDASDGEEVDAGGSGEREDRS
ncbi:hypothetical protein HK104_002461 [Borealophlyctis nickersoniae]|nr:hypothetical protein HK104_002461 [Borealophlyctis nickersoniae]